MPMTTCALALGAKVAATYSRSPGVFAGITLDGAVVQQDSDSTRAIYGRDQSFETILSGKVSPPKSTLAFTKAIAETGRAGAVAEVSADKK